MDATKGQLASKASEPGGAATIQPGATAAARPGQRPQTQASGGRTLFADLGFGVVLGIEGLGPEVEASVRWMFVPKFGASVGLLAGYEFLGAQGDGLRIGMLLSAYYQLSDSLAVGLGFKGFPEYINNLGGITVSAMFGRLYARAALDVMGMDAVAVDVGLTL